MTIVIEDPFVLYSVLFGIMGLVGIIWSYFQMKKNRVLLKELKERERQMSVEVLPTEWERFAYASGYDDGCRNIQEKYVGFTVGIYNKTMYDEAFANAYMMGHQHACLKIPALYKTEDDQDNKPSLIGRGF